MLQRKFTIKNLMFIAFLVLMFTMPTFFMAFSFLNFNKPLYAEETEITISNSNFTSFDSSKPGNPNSFSEEGTKGNTISGVIDTSTTKFHENNSENYKLTFNPSKPEIAEDNYVLMINNQNLNSSFGYVSSNFTLSKNGHYVISAYVYTQYNDISSTASLYLGNDTLNYFYKRYLEGI